MKTPIQYLVFCCLSLAGISHLSAQEGDGRQQVEHSIGLNTFGILDHIFSDDDSGDLRNPYLITYTAVLGKLALRTAIGPEYTSGKVTHEGFTNTEESRYLRLDGRLGAGLVILDEGRWNALAGIDGVISYVQDRKIDDSGFDRITDQMETQAFGGGPFIHISWHASRKISLAVESTAYWIHANTEHTELYRNFPDYNTVLSKTSSNRLRLTLPNTIFLRLHF